MAISTLEHYRISELFEEFPSDTTEISTLESAILIYELEKSHTILRIPLHVFSETNLGILEAATKYLKENNLMKYCEIAKFLHRDERTIWASYNNAIKKKESKFETDKTTYFVPCNIFSNRKLGPLENVVVYLKDDLKLSTKEISVILKRPYMVIYLSYTNGKKK